MIIELYKWIFAFQLKDLFPVRYLDLYLDNSKIQNASKANEPYRSAVLPKQEFEF